MTILDRATTTALVAGEADALAAFTEQWLANRRLSENTRAAYRRDVAAWAAWCASNGTNPLHATFLDLNTWGRSLETPQPRTGRPLAAATVARRMSAVSSWYDFLVKLGAIRTNPASAADRPRVDRDYSPTVAFGERDAAALLDAVAAGDRHLGSAAAPIVAVLVDLGIRVSELCGLDIGDLGHDGGHRTLSLTMKGGKRRRRALPPAVSAAIDRYLQGRAGRAGVDVGQLSGPLFVSPAGDRIDRHEVYRFVRRLARQAGLPNADKITPHSFRSAWVTIARQRGASLEARQFAMGHADSRTTQRYDRQRENLDGDPAFLVAAAVGGAT